MPVKGKGPPMAGPFHMVQVHVLQEGRLSVRRNR
ncbi:hypothetical protein C8D96_2149 [Kushneria marisflavi]|nr:hypothetical protein C8D96_2149 [Kushneria marisflavi]